MGELGALRLAGRAGGIEEHCGVLAVPVRDLVVRGGGGEEIAEAGRIDDDRLRVRVLGAAARFVRELMPGEDQPGPGVAEVISHLPPLEQRVHRDDHTARAEHAIVGDGELGDVGLHDPHPVAGLEAALAQHPGDPGARLVEFGVCGRGVIHAHGHPVGVRPHRVRQVGCEVGHDGPPSSEAPSLRGAKHQETFIFSPANQAVDGPSYQVVPGHWFPGTTRRLRGGCDAELVRFLTYVRPDGGIREGRRPTPWQ